MINSIANKVLLVNVDRVVLPDQMLETLSEALDRPDVVLVLFCLLDETKGLVNLTRIYILWPTTWWKSVNIKT